MRASRIHFQALARRLTVHPALRAADAGLPFKPYIGYWQDAADGVLRIVGVRRNLFVQTQLTMPDLAAAAAPDATPHFAPTHLKNGQQMLAAEGVIAPSSITCSPPTAPSAPGSRSATRRSLPRCRH